MLLCVSQGLDAELSTPFLLQALPGPVLRYGLDFSGWSHCSPLLLAVSLTFSGLKLLGLLF